MEKRWCERIPVPINVVIYHNGFRVIECKVKDLSLRGICLASSPLVYNKNTEVSIEFPNMGSLADNNRQIKAIVVRDAFQEIGMMFNPTKPEMINTILKEFRNNQTYTCEFVN